MLCSLFRECERAPDMGDGGRIGDEVTEALDRFVLQ